MTHEQDITNICIITSGLLASGHYTEAIGDGDPLTKLQQSGNRIVTRSAIRIYEDICEKWEKSEPKG